MGLWPASDAEGGRDGERFPQWEAREKKFSNGADNAIVIDTHQPSTPLTFDTTCSLNQRDSQIATKVYLVHNTGNKAKSGTMMVQRPFQADGRMVFINFWNPRAWHRNLTILLPITPLLH